MKHLVTAAFAVTLTACGYGWKDESSNVYPPSDRAAIVAGKDAGRAVAGPGEYLVQPGDTLYSIGFHNQLDYHEVADWNNIGRDYRILAGQLLRLTPPAGTGSVIAKPLADPDAVVTTPLPQPTSIPADTLPGPVSQPPPPPVMPTVPVLSVPPVAKVMPQGNSGLRWQWPTSGNVIKSYSMATGSKGIDIAGELGQPVLAVAAGKVVYSGSALKGYGELIIIKHDDTYLSAYGHNRRRLVKEGDEVRAGQTIAELGLGPEQKPLVHFEIRENGKPVDPLGFLPSH